MATLKVLDVLEIANTYEHNATSWQISDTADFSHLLIDIVRDEINLLLLRVLIRNDDGTLYEFLGDTFARVKLHYGDHDTPWFNIGVCNSINNEDLE